MRVTKVVATIRYNKNTLQDEHMNPLKKMGTFSVISLIQTGKKRSKSMCSMLITIKNP